MSEVRARVEHNVMVDGVSVWLVMGPIGHRFRVRFTEQGIVTHEPVPTGVTIDPSFSMEDDVARALLDALLDHYGHATGGRLQRADFEHERARRDKLEDAMIAIIKDAAGVVDGG